MGFLASLAGGASPGKALGMSGAGLGVTAALGADKPAWLKMLMNQGGGQGGGMTEGVMGFNPVDRGSGQGPSMGNRILSGAAQGLQQMGGGGEAPQLPDMGDPLAVLRNMGFDLNSNHLGRLR